MREAVEKDLAELDTEAQAKISTLRRTNDDHKVKYAQMERWQQSNMFGNLQFHFTVLIFMLNATNVYQGMEMLHLFLIDVIGRKSAAAKIFNAKIDEEWVAVNWRII
jgi:hypothetical protein